MKKNELRDAVNILTRLINEKISYKQSFNAQTTSLTKEICFGVCRNFFFLDAIALSLVKKKPKDSSLWLTLLVGIYQIKFLSTPEYAAVKETVGILKRPWEKNFINAILRNYLRENAEIDKQISLKLSANYNHPIWFIEKIKAAYPNAWQKILTANNQRPPMSIRVNNSQISSAQYLQLLKAENINAEPQTDFPSGIIITNPIKATELPGFDDGLVSIQDLAAQMAVTMLDLKDGDNVLDACAAPGGKTCHILETNNNLTKCVALDIDEKRVAKIHENLRRLKLNATVLISDCLDTDKWWDGKPFNRILLDAPCSATGVIRRHPDIKLLRTPEEILNIVQVQQKLLKKLWKLLAPGGRLVYATCSILPEENSQQIQNFIKNTPDCKLANKQSIEQRNQYGRQILPGENNMDGFFYSALIKA